MSGRSANSTLRQPPGSSESNWSYRQAGSIGACASMSFGRFSKRLRIRTKSLLAAGVERAPGIAPTRLVSTTTHVSSCRRPYEFCHAHEALNDVFWGPYALAARSSLAGANPIFTDGFLTGRNTKVSVLPRSACMLKGASSTANGNKHIAIAAAASRGIGPPSPFFSAL